MSFPRGDSKPFKNNIWIIRTHCSWAPAMLLKSVPLPPLTTDQSFTLGVFTAFRITLDVNLPISGMLLDPSVQKFLFFLTSPFSQCPFFNFFRYSNFSRYCTQKWTQPFSSVSIFVGDSRGMFCFRVFDCFVDGVVKKILHHRIFSDTTRTTKSSRLEKNVHLFQYGLLKRRHTIRFKRLYPSQRSKENNFQINSTEVIFKQKEFRVYFWTFISTYPSTRSTERIR